MKLEDWLRSGDGSRQRMSDSDEESGSGDAGRKGDMEAVGKRGETARDSLAFGAREEIKDGDRVGVGEADSLLGQVELE